MENGEARQVPKELGEPTCLGFLFFLIGQIFYWFFFLIGQIFYWVFYLIGKTLHWVFHLTRKSLYGMSFVVMVTIALIGGQIKFLIMKLRMRHVIKTVVKVAIKKKIFLLLSVVAIIVDPLFFYIPLMNDDKKCIGTDKYLGITVTVLRSVCDLLKIIHFISELLEQLGAKPKRTSRVRLWLFFLIDILASLPLPQVIVNLQRIRGTDILYSMSLSLIQYSLRIIRTYYLFREATGVTGILAEAAWAIVVFNILLYTQGGHVFGALWYFYAIAKVTACWKKACINHTECDHTSFYCGRTVSRNYSFLNDYCGINTGDTTNFDFGLFDDAIESGILEVTQFPKKLLPCLQWGLKNLSAFGQNLPTRTDIWENIFAICMTNIGVVLFVFLIGNMQSNIARSKKIRHKWKEIKQWPHFKDISSDVRGQLRKYMRENWHETKDVDVDNLINELPDDELANKIKRNLCIKLLKNVNEFQNWSEKSLGYLCEFLKPVSFVKRAHIIREGDPIDEMMFVLKGNLWTYTSSNAIATTGSNRRSRAENRLKGGDVFGKEIIFWAQNDSSSSLPIATKTIQAFTDVEAFSLMAVDLKHVLSLRHFDRPAIVLQTYWRLRKVSRDRKKAQQKSLFKRALDWAEKELR